MGTEKVLLPKATINLMLSIVDKIKSKTASLEDYHKLIDLLVSNGILKEEDINNILSENKYDNFDDFYQRNTRPFVEPDYLTQSRIIGTLSGATYNTGSFYIQEEKRSKNNK